MKKRFWKGFVLASSMFGFALPIQPLSASYIFTILKLDTPGNVGKYVSIAHDSTNEYNIMSYYDETNRNLKVTSIGEPGGPWNITVDSAGDVGIDSDIAVHEGVAYISYFDATNGDLKLASQVQSGGNCGPNNTWKCETVDAGGIVGSNSSIVVTCYPWIYGCNDVTPWVSISYLDESNGDLKYAERSGAGYWRIQTIDSANKTGLETSIDRVDGGTTYITYLDSTVNDLRMASIVGYLNGNCGKDLSWKCQTLDGLNNNMGRGNSLDLDSNGKVHISYYDVTSRAVKYLTNASGLWSFTRVANFSFGAGILETSIAVDRNNAPHISYTSYTNFSPNLYHAVKVNPGAGNCSLSNSWECVKVDNASNVGSYNAMIAGDYADMSIVYYDRYFANLKYAH